MNQHRNLKECFDWVTKYYEKIENVKALNDRRGFIAQIVLQTYNEIKEKDKIEKKGIDYFYSTSEGWRLSHAVNDLMEILRK